VSNKIIFTSNINIGQNGAESDNEFLFKCYVDHPAQSELRDLSNPLMFVLGSTGAGKTAVLRMIAKQEKCCKEIELHEMAMNHIANSDVVQFLQSIEVDLDLFFQALWRHVICIEYIKLIGIAESDDKFRFAVRKIVDSITGNKARDKLEKFLTQNEKNFWNTIDENIIEFTTGLERKVNAEMGAEVEKYTARAGYSRGLSQEKRVQLQQRAKKFVNSDTIAELAHVVSALSEYTRGRLDRYFLLIDKLDEHWVEESIKFPLIHALFETLQGLQKLRNFKVVVALRNDLYERMLTESVASRAQIEKYNDYVLRLRWTKEQLWSLAEKRINHLFKWKYSSNNVFFDDIFVQQVDSRQPVWAYIVDRTLMRPRDVINFINLALQTSEGKSEVSKSNLLRAEHEYSDLRLKTLLFEWEKTYSGIGVILDLLKSRPPYFQVSEFVSSDLSNTLYDKMGATEAGQQDEIWQLIDKSLREGQLIEPIELARVMFRRLHLIGAVGLKTEASGAWQWISYTPRPVPVHSIDPGTKVQIHSMLHFALHNVERSK
jgi:Cdc6-like AAA superfamily ATPase